MVRDMNDEYAKENKLEGKSVYEKYEEYVKNCHSDPNTFVTEYNFKEWLEAGRPNGL